MSGESTRSLRPEAMQHLERAWACEECDAAIRTDPTLAEAFNLRDITPEQLGRIWGLSPEGTVIAMW